MKQTRRSSLPNWAWGMWLQGDEAAATRSKFYLEASVSNHLGAKPNDPSVILLCCLHFLGSFLTCIASMRKLVALAFFLTPSLALLAEWICFCLCCSAVEQVCFLGFGLLCRVWSRERQICCCFADARFGGQSLPLCLRLKLEGNGRIICSVCLNVLGKMSSTFLGLCVLLIMFWIYIWAYRKVMN